MECDTWEKLVEHKQLRKNMSLMTENEFHQESGCPPPCTFFKYKIVGYESFVAVDQSGDLDFSKMKS